VLLKILLQQTNLDKPFSGGLGSYKLYVMIAHHYKSHMALGGGSSAAEILLSFLYRYSDIDSEYLDRGTKNEMSESTLIRCDGGEADLKTGIKVERCASLFGVCYHRIMQRLEQQCHGYNVSIIGSIIDCIKLESSRKISMGMAAQSMKKIQNSSYFSDRDPNKSVAGKRVSYTFSKSCAYKDRVPLQQPTRGPRGSLIPKCRPDVDAKPKGIEALFLRGGKFRKNKKKQKRDAALNNFVATW